MFYKWRLNNRVNNIHEKIIYKNCAAFFTDLLAKDNSLSVPHRSLQKFITEIFKSKTGINPEMRAKLMWKILVSVILLMVFRLFSFFFNFAFVYYYMWNKSCLKLAFLQFIPFSMQVSCQMINWLISYNLLCSCYTSNLFHLLVSFCIFVLVMFLDMFYFSIDKLAYSFGMLILVCNYHLLHFNYFLDFAQFFRLI